MTEWFRTARFGDWIAQLRATSQATLAWQQAHREVLRGLLTVWQAHPAAAEATAWKKADETLTAIQKELRQQRQDTLTPRLRDAVAALLPDAGVEIADISHKGGTKQRRGLDIELRVGGRTATLGMLSSGQRNALLLASLLCTGSGGPFGFLVVDDPVHALDDLRVDLLAKELTRLAADRQVLVLTHDGRLEEHLRAWHPGLEVVELARDADRAEVSVTSRRSPWDQLLKDATDFAASAKGGKWQADDAVREVVGGMCRNAVDGAIRQAVINAGTRLPGRTVLDQLDALNTENTTRRRLQYVLQLAGDGALPHTRQCHDTDLLRWNGASHGDPRNLRRPQAEIAVARRVCEELHRWRAPAGAET